MRDVLSVRSKKKYSEVTKNMYLHTIQQNFKQK